MSQNPQLPPPSGSRDDGMIQIMVLFVAVIILLLIVMAGMVSPVVPRMADRAGALESPRVYFITPQDGDTVPQTFTVQMGAEGIIVEPAGEIREGAGHFHILVNEDFVGPGELIPIDTANYLHYGQGQTEVELTLPPGEYTLRLQLADGAHMGLEGDAYRDEIAITVE